MAQSLRLALDGEVVDVPLYDPAALDTPALRTPAPDGSGDVLAMRLVESPGASSDHALSLGGPAGAVWAIDLSTATTLADFEDGDWPGDWTDETSQYSLTTNAIQGTYSLRADTEFPQVANPTVTTERGRSYSLLIAPSTNGRGWLLTNVQDANNALDDAYVAVLDEQSDEIRLRRRTNSSGVGLDSVGVGQGVDSGTVYRLVLDVATDAVQARLLDAGGAELAATGYVSDTTYSGGYPGIYTDTGGVGNRYDDVAAHPLGAV